MQVRSQIVDLLYYMGIFRAHLGNAIYLVFALTLCAAIAESVGVLLLIPLLQNLGADNPEGQSGLPRIINTAVSFVGVPPSPTAILLLITAVFLFKGLLVFAISGLRAFFKAKLLRDLKGKMFDNYSRMDFKHYTSHSTGYFSAIINDQINALLGAFEALCNLISQIITTVVYVAIAFVVAWKFGCMAIFAGVALLFIFKNINGLIRNQSRKYALESFALAKLLIQTLQGYKYLSSTGQFSRLRDQAVASIDRLTIHEFRIGLGNALVASAREPIAVTLIALIAIVQLNYFKQPIAPIFVSILLFHRGLNSTLSIQGAWLTTLGLIGSVEAVHNEFLNQFTNQEPDGDVLAGPLSEGVEFAGVYYSYNDNSEYVLQNVNLKIPAFSTIAIVGTSGAGKSTLIDLMTLLLQPSQGTVFIDGVDATKINRMSWRKQIGYVTQEAVVFDDSIANNISMWAGNTESDPDIYSRIIQAAKAAFIHDFVSALPHGFETQVGDRGVRLSGGQKQRIIIARELFRNPHLLILDEATSALDSESEVKIQESIDSIKGKLTAIVIAHRLSTVRNVDMVYVLENGRIVESGKFDELRGIPESRLGKLIDLQTI